MEILKNIHNVKYGKLHPLQYKPSIKTLYIH